MKASALISPAYLEEQRRLHAAPRGYGGKGAKWAGPVVRLAWEYRCVTLLDYGCGQGSLCRAIVAAPSGLFLHEYDPAIEGKHKLPAPADLVVCTDVLEHIEPARLDSVLAHLAELTQKVLFVVIATRPANKTLSDGTNAHLIIETAAWWQARVEGAGFVVHPGPASPSEKPSREWVAVLTKVAS